MAKVEEVHTCMYDSQPVAELSIRIALLFLESSKQRGELLHGSTKYVLGLLRQWGNADKYKK